MLDDDNLYPAPFKIDERKILFVQKRKTGIKKICTEMFPSYVLFVFNALKQHCYTMAFPYPNNYGVIY